MPCPFLHQENIQSKNHNRVGNEEAITRRRINIMSRSGKENESLVTSFKHVCSGWPEAVFSEKTFSRLPGSNILTRDLCLKILVPPFGRISFYFLFIRRGGASREKRKSQLRCHHSPGISHRTACRLRRSSYVYAGRYFAEYRSFRVWPRSIIGRTACSGVVAKGGHLLYKFRQLPIPPR